MRIEQYFDQIRGWVEACPVIQLSNIAFEKRGTYQGFLHGELILVDGSVLHIREYLDLETQIERLAYVYQLMGEDGALIFRYDNTGHHRRLNLPTYPHHKHAGNEDQVAPSSAPDLQNVLSEVQLYVKLP